MKILSLTFALLFASCTLVFAQSAIEGRYALTKKVASEAPGVSILLSNSLAYVESALAQKFQSVSKNKPKNMGKGVMMYEAVVLREVSDATLNYYYRMEETGSGAAKMTKVTLFISPGHDNFYSSEKYPNEMRAAERMLQNLDQNAARLVMQDAMSAQSQVIAEQEKIQADLVNQQSSLQKTQESLAKEMEKLQTALLENQAALEKNRLDQENQQRRIAEEVSKMQTIQKANSGQE